MSAMKDFLERFSARLPYREIRGPSGESYLERYFLFEFPEWWLFGKWAGGCVYLHRFVDSDPDRGEHDHPWDRAYSLVLAGSYTEHRLKNIWAHGVERRRRLPGRLASLNGTDFHRVVLSWWEKSTGGCWTLFWHSRRAKGWGFAKVAYTGFGEFGVEMIPFYPSATTATHDRWWLDAGTRETAGE
jgi:hypothetical protein